MEEELRHINSNKGVTFKDVSAEDFINAFAAFLKKSDKFKVPECITAYVETDQDTFSLTRGENNWHHPDENFNRDLWNDWLIIHLNEKSVKQCTFFYSDIKQRF